MVVYCIVPKNKIYKNLNCFYCLKESFFTYSQSNYSCYSKIFKIENKQEQKENLYAYIRIYIKNNRITYLLISVRNGKKI